MYALSEVVFVFFTVVVLAACLMFGYTVYASSERNARAMYLEQLNATLRLLKYYPDAAVYSPIPYEGRVIHAGGGQ